MMATLEASLDSATTASIIRSATVANL